MYIYTGMFLCSGWHTVSYFGCPVFDSQPEHYLSSSTCFLHLSFSPGKLFGNNMKHGVHVSFRILINSSFTWSM
jgi:hypothetical protein